MELWNFITLVLKLGRTCIGNKKEDGEERVRKGGNIYSVTTVDAQESSC